GNGRYSPFEIIRVGTGDSNESASAGTTFSSCSSLNQESSSREPSIRSLAIRFSSLATKIRLFTASPVSDHLDPDGRDHGHRHRVHATPAVGAAVCRP